MTPAAEALVLAHLGLVERIAKYVAKKMPAWIEMEELVATGNVGLVEAASKYSAELHPSFPHYAFLFIRGRMIDAYRGRNYPRLTEQLPDEWMGERCDANGRAATGLVPPQLIDPAPNPEELVLAEEEQALLILDVELATRRLTVIERKTVKGHLEGKPLREIGAKQKRSAAWAHYTLHGARKKLAEQLDEYDKAA